MIRNTLRYDPTRTTMLRKSFLNDMRRRFRLLQQEVRKLVVIEDVFGLRPSVHGVFNFDEDQERDERGRWTSGGGGGAASKEVGKKDSKQVLSRVQSAEKEFNQRARTNLDSLYKGASIYNYGSTEPFVQDLKDYTMKDIEPVGKVAASIEKAVAASPGIEHDIVSYRGVRVSEKDLGTIQKSFEKNGTAEIRLDRPASFTNSDSAAWDFAKDKGHRGLSFKGKGVLMRIRIPKGTKVALLRFAFGVGEEHAIGKGARIRIAEIKSYREGYKITGEVVGGAVHNTLATNADKQAWRFQTNPQKLKSFLMRRRFRLLQQEVRKLIVAEDVFGLRPSVHGVFNESITTNADKQAWRFQTNPQKLKSFNGWLDKQVKKGVLQVDGNGKPWHAKYIESAYKKGAMRAYADTHPEITGETMDFYRGRRSGFLESSFNAPEKRSKMEFIYSRTYEDLKGVSSVMAQKMSRTLADSIVHGLGAEETARQLVDAIGSISRQRADVIARTELIAAHAEGQLDAFEELGLDEVRVLAEWVTAGDEKVCDECQPLEGVVMTIDEARGLIPRHPSCRCAWMPAGVGEKDPGQVFTKGDKERAVARSLKAEGGRAASDWAGKGVEFKSTPTNR